MIVIFNFVKGQIVEINEFRCRSGFLLDSNVISINKSLSGIDSLFLNDEFYGLERKECIEDEYCGKSIYRLIDDSLMLIFGEYSKFKSSDVELVKTVWRQNEKSDSLYKMSFKKVTKHKGNRVIRSTYDQSNNLYHWELANMLESDTLLTINCINNMCFLDSFPDTLGEKNHIIYYRDFQEFDEIKSLTKKRSSFEYDFSAFHKAEIIETSEQGNIITEKVYSVSGSEKTLASEKIIYKDNVTRKIRYVIHCPR